MAGRYAPVPLSEDADVAVPLTESKRRGQEHIEVEGTSRSAALPLPLLGRVSDYCDEETLRELMTSSATLRDALQDRHGHRGERELAARQRSKQSLLAVLFALVDGLLLLGLMLCACESWRRAALNAEPGHEIPVAEISLPLVAWSALAAALLLVLKCIQACFTTATKVPDSPFVDISAAHLQLPALPFVNLASGLGRESHATTIWVLLAAALGERLCHCQCFLSC